MIGDWPCYCSFQTDLPKCPQKLSEKRHLGCMTFRKGLNVTMSVSLGIVGQTKAEK